jgi:hypothetical protein
MKVCYICGQRFLNTGLAAYRGLDGELRLFCKACLVERMGDE